MNGATRPISNNTRNSRQGAADATTGMPVAPAGLGEEEETADDNRINLLQACLPNKPAGRSNSTMTMMTKITTAEASG